MCFFQTYMCLHIEQRVVCVLFFHNTSRISIYSILDRMVFENYYFYDDVSHNYSVTTRCMEQATGLDA